MEPKYFDEKWESVKDFEGRFWISSYGRLRSHDLRKNTIKILPCYIDNLGYLQTTLRMKPLKRKVRIHTLVAEHFLINPELPVRQTVNHIDGNKLNNRVSNLEWISAKENCSHAVRIGLYDIKGSNHPASKVNESQVIEMRRLFSTGVSSKEISIKFNLSAKNTRDIVNKRSWKHV